jgi:ribosomal protein S27AE
MQAMDEDERGARPCPSCGAGMLPIGLPSGEIVSRCPSCGQVAI